MTGEEIVKQIQCQYQEWFEMSDKPQELLVGILVKKLAGSYEYIEYLEKRVEYERANSR